jgi:hypothetical protein
MSAMQEIIRKLDQRKQLDNLRFVITAATVVVVEDCVVDGMTATRTGTSTAANNNEEINTAPNTRSIHDGFDAASAAFDADVAAPLKIHIRLGSSQ